MPKTVKQIYLHNYKRYKEFEDIRAFSTLEYTTFIDFIGFY